MALARTPGRRGLLAVVADGRLKFFPRSPFGLIDAVVVVGVIVVKVGFICGSSFASHAFHSERLTVPLPSASQTLKPSAQPAATAGVPESNITATKAAQYLVIAFSPNTHLSP